MNDSTPSILYVDDDRANRVVFERSFANSFQVLTAESADAALSLLKERRVGVVITDQRMPGLSGNELLKRVKHLYPDIVRLVITAYSDSQPAIDAINEGLVAGYFLKPWDREQLATALAWALETHILAKENAALQLRLLEVERLATIGIMGSAMVHDINQPLAYLSGNATRLEQLAASRPVLLRLLDAHGAELSAKEAGLVQDLSVEIEEIARDMSRGCLALQGITREMNRMLSPSERPREGQARCEPLSVIRYALSVCRDVALRSNACVSFDGASELPRVRMGATELMQTIINIVKNAAEAVGRNATPGGRVVVSALVQDREVEFVIRDEGPGMPPEVFEKAGDLFFTTRADGMGLGIAQCKRLVAGAGSELHIESEPGKGTVVSFAIPRV